MNNIIIEHPYKIIDIKHRKTNETRTDGRYPLRIGSTINFYIKPCAGVVALLNYIADNEGNPKMGTLRTSTVTDIDENNNHIIIETLNSIYILEEIVGDINE